MATQTKVSPLKRTLYGCAIAWCTGYINTNTFMRFGIFSGFQTGNSIALATSLVTPIDGVRAGLAAAAVAAFAVGAALAVIANVPARRRNGSFLALMLLLVGVTAGGEASLPYIGKYAGLPYNGFMGAIDYIGFKGVINDKIAYITGNLQKTIAATVFILGRRGTPTDRVKAFVEAKELLQFFFSFLFGAYSSALAVRLLWQSHQWTGFPPVVFAAALIVLMEQPPKSVLPIVDA
ncbi:hypothetical protein M885DRAFT_563095 [Pelagophyceae sp. CCMP2097]|nr:hypothetical protein M885DRAFT_563095 [Pelagophyceae sp. CCMP2097]|mmetsp:Transcript_12851/g.42915  ORF Transcript_12851/g.42915 Transcript_12851/m.42915 type:complete len:235 (+) Transcript_12851:322-1026(+)